jgi:hypothetical protein
MPRLVRWIWTLLALHLLVGLGVYLHYLITREYTLLNWYFSGVGPLFFLLMTASECSLALICCSWFDRDEPMRLAWSMIACAALARFTGTILRQISPEHWPWKAARLFDSLAPAAEAHIGEIGMVIGGPVAMAFLAVGLWRVLRIERRFHLIGPPTRGDKALIAVILAFTISQLTEILPLVWQWNHPTYTTVLLWLSDPLLSLLLVEAVLIRRSVLRMGRGLVAQCWGMLVVAIVSTSAGDAALWATEHNLLPEFVAPLGWYIWFVAAAAFACAPAYQLSAISLARTANMH